MDGKYKGSIVEVVFYSFMLCFFYVVVGEGDSDIVCVINS